MERLLCCETSVCGSIDKKSMARIAASIFYERFVCFRFIIFRPQFQSCGSYGGLIKMAAIKITWLQILARADTKLLDPVFLRFLKETIFEKDDF